MTRGFGAPVRPAGRARAAVKGPRPEGSWAASIERAREAWDGLAGGPDVVRACSCGGAAARVAHYAGCPAGDGPVYSDRAAAAILATALGLWADTAAGMAEGD